MLFFIWYIECVFMKYEIIIERKKAMSKINMVTGGVASGKSRWAATYFAACDNVLYMCVRDELDKEVADRIKWNCDHRSTEWVIKCGFTLDDAETERHKFFIFDDVASYTSRYIGALGLSEADMTAYKKKEVQTGIINDITALISRVQVREGNMIIITSEMGFSPEPVSIEQRFFRDVLGGVNQRISNVASDVYLSVSGIQTKIK